MFGMVIPPLIGNPYNGYINPYVIRLMSLSPDIWFHNGSLEDPGTGHDPSRPPAVPAEWHENLVAQFLAKAPLLLEPKPPIFVQKPPKKHVKLKPHGNRPGTRDPLLPPMCFCFIIFSQLMVRVGGLGPCWDPGSNVAPKNFRDLHDLGHPATHTIPIGIPWSHGKSMGPAHQSRGVPCPWESLEPSLI